MENNNGLIPNDILPNNPNRKPIFMGIIIAVFILLLFAGLLLLYQKKLDITFQAKPTPTPFPHNIPNVLFPGKPDPSGRNIYYVTNDLGGNIKYSGVGVQTLPPGTRFTSDKGETLFTTSTSSAMTNYIVGSFDSWEKIPGSRDMYVILKDLLGVRTQQGEILPIPKVRVGFSTENIDSQKNIFGTAFGVEELNSVIPKVVNKNGGIKLYKIGLIGNISTEDLETLIRPGDAVTVTIIPDFTNQKDFLDETNNIIASWLFIRRYDPKTALTEELNKPINLQ